MFHTVTHKISYPTTNPDYPFIYIRENDCNSVIYGFCFHFVIKNTQLNINGVCSAGGNNESQCTGLVSVSGANVFVRNSDLCPPIRWTTALFWHFSFVTVLMSNLQKTAPEILVILGNAQLGTRALVLTGWLMPCRRDTVFDIAFQMVWRAM